MSLLNTDDPIVCLNILHNKTSELQDKLIHLNEKHQLELEDSINHLYDVLQEIVMKKAKQQKQKGE